MENNKIKVNDLYVATPIQLQDKEIYTMTFCLIKNGKVHFINKSLEEKCLFKLPDANNIDEYYTNNFYVQKYAENKEYLFKQYNSIENVKSLMKLNDAAEIEQNELKLIERAVNAVYLSMLQNDELVY